jgi:hypothetical protein
MKAHAAGRLVRQEEYGDRCSDESIGGGRSRRRRHGGGGERRNARDARDLERAKRIATGVEEKPIALRRP